MSRQSRPGWRYNMLYVNEDASFEEAADMLEHYLWHKKSANEWLSALQKRSHFIHDEQDDVLKAIGKAMLELPYKNPIIYDDVVFTMFTDKDSLIHNVVVTTTAGDFIGQYCCATIESLARMFEDDGILNNVFGGISQGLFVMTAKYLAMYTTKFDI